MILHEILDNKRRFIILNILMNLGLKAMYGLIDEQTDLAFPYIIWDDEDIWETSEMRIQNSEPCIIKLLTYEEAIELLTKQITDENKR